MIKSLQDKLNASQDSNGDKSQEIAQLQGQLTQLKSQLDQMQKEKDR